MAARAGVEPTTLRLRAIASTNAPPCPTCVCGFFIVGILCSVSIASNPERYHPLHCHFHFGCDIEGRQRSGYVRSHFQYTTQHWSFAATLVHIIITARSDYCSTLYTGIPTIRLSCLYCVLRSAARLIGKIRSCSQKLAQTCPKYWRENQSIGERW